MAGPYAQSRRRVATMVLLAAGTAIAGASSGPDRFRHGLQASAPVPAGRPAATGSVAPGVLPLGPQRAPLLGGVTPPVQAPASLAQVIPGAASARAAARRAALPRNAVAAAAQSLATLEPIDDLGTVPYFIADGMPGSAFRPADRDLATWALAAWERALDGALRFTPAASEEEALVRIHWVPAGAGQYGEMRPLLVRGRRGAAVYIRPDTTALGADIAERAAADPLLRDTIVYLTCVHELGHAVGLAHTASFDDIMYFFGFGGDIPRFFGRYRETLGSRADIRNRAGLSAADVTRVRALYAKR